MTRGSLRSRPLKRALLPFIQLVLLTTSSGLLHGQDLIGLRKRQGEMGYDFRGAWNGFGPSRSRNANHREWIKIPFHGMLFGPRILKYSVTFRPAFSQGLSSGVSTVTANQINLDASARIFTASPVSLTVATSRSDGSSSGGFGAETDFYVSTWNASLVWRNSFFPGRLTYTSRTLDQSWLTSQVVGPVRRAERVETLTYSARSSKTRIRLERTNYDDRSGTRDFNALTAVFGHAFRWGKGSRLQTSVDFTNRTNSQFPYDRITWGERLHLQHTRSVGTDYAYQSFSSTVNGAKSGSRSYTLGLHARLARWIRSNVQWRRHLTTVADQTSSVYAIAPGISFFLPLPRTFRLSGNASVGYEKRDQPGPQDGRLPVLNERHRVDESRNFILNNAGVDISTVVLTNSQQTLTLVRGFDYDLFISGDIVTVELLPTGRVRPGEIVLVTYFFSFGDRRRRNETITATYGATATLFGVTVSHRQALRNSRASIEGTPVTVPDFTQTTTRITANRNTPLGAVRLAGERRSRTSATADHVAYNADLSLALPPSRKLQTTLGVTWSHSASGPDNLTSVAANAFVNWAATGLVTVRFKLSGFTVNRSDSGFERFLGGMVDANLRFGALESSLRYEHQVRTSVISGTIDRFSARVIRRF